MFNSAAALGMPQARQRVRPGDRGDVNRRERSPRKPESVRRAEPTGEGPRSFWGFLPLFLGDVSAPGRRQSRRRGYSGEPASGSQ